MGYRAIVPSARSFDKRNREHKALFSAIHRARVYEVSITDGTISVQLESLGYSDKITMPLLGLSAPPDKGSQAPNADFRAASWGRYIPQIGDLIYVGFDMNGSMYSLGYASIFYQGFDIGEKREASDGGISWGEESEKRLKPGDWDFKSSRGACFYLGGQAKLSSGQNSISLNRDTGDIIINTPLLDEQIGFSNFRYGAVRRFVLPTDTSESYLYTNRAGSIAQEATLSVRWLGAPTGVDLAYWSIGDVVDDSLGAYALKLSGATVPQPVRRYFYSHDFTGYIKTYEEEVDSGGNFLVKASSATDFSWSTPLASWDITNLRTSITSTTNIMLESLSIQLGNGAVEPVIKGSTSIANLSAYLIALSANYKSLASGCLDIPILIDLAPFFMALSVAADVYNASLSNTLSTKVFTR